MQHDHPLTLQLILERMRRMHADGEVVGVRDGARTALSYGDLADRVDRLARALDGLGVEAGDRVATFAWNTPEHLEVYLAVPCIGAVLHTVNVRLFADQVDYIVNHAQDRVVFVDDSLVPVLEKLAPRLETVRSYVVVGDGDAGSLPERDRLRGAPRRADRRRLRLPRARRAPGRRPLLHERHHRQPEGRPLLAPLERPARPRTVPGRLDRRPRRRPRACRSCRCSTPTPGACPTAAPWSGADLVMPGRFLSGEPLAPPDRGRARHRRRRRPDDLDGPAALRRRARPGPRPACAPSSAAASAVPRVADARLRGAPRRPDPPGLGDDRDQPARRRRPSAAGRRRARTQWRYRAATGTASRRSSRSGIDRRRRRGGAVGRRGRPARSRSAAPGSRATTTRTIRAAPRSSTTAGCAPATSPSIDPRGFMRITDRAKDVIKSGGEWISSVELENELMAHPDGDRGGGDREARRALDRAPARLRRRRGGPPAHARRAARPPRRPRSRSGGCRTTFAFVDEVPKTSVGKFDKKVLRARLEEGRLEQAEPAQA